MYSSGKEILARRVSFSIACVVASLALVASGVENTAARSAGFSAFANAPLYFEQNTGQIEESAPFIARGAQCSVLLAPTAAEILLGKPSAQDGDPSASERKPARCACNSWAPIRPRRCPAASRCPPRQIISSATSPPNGTQASRCFPKCRSMKCIPACRLFITPINPRKLEYDFVPEARRGGGSNPFPHHRRG